MFFNFHQLKVYYPNKEKWTKAPFDFLELKKIINDWQLGLGANGGWNALFWNNHDQPRALTRDRKSTRLNSSHVSNSYAVFCVQKHIPYRSAIPDRSSPCTES